MSRLGENEGAARWFKSSYSSGQYGCVEVARTDAQTWVRDSKQPHEGNLQFGHEQWQSFLRSLREG